MEKKDFPLPQTSSPLDQRLRYGLCEFSVDNHLAASHRRAAGMLEALGCYGDGSHTSTIDGLVIM